MDIERCGVVAEDGIAFLTVGEAAGNDLDITESVEVLRWVVVEAVIACLVPVVGTLAVEELVAVFVFVDGVAAAVPDVARRGFGRVWLGMIRS